ncbi:16S rRNA (guanine(966)-N(2))-methyltransferase [Pseudonocardia sp. N23]|nr:16S rRNA (guanine(966)-N(2))-methyltransferase [Pseudonocardia sp. N23]
MPPRGTRPTSDRVREALFSALDADPGLDGARVLDLCAGSGALGLEALSRGAAHAVFVESDRKAANILRRNVSEIGLGGEVVATTVATALAGAPRGRFDVVLADPPYTVPDDEIAGWLTMAARGGWLAEETVVVVERAARSGAFGWPEGFDGLRERRYGDTVLHLGVRYGPAS